MNRLRGLYILDQAIYELVYGPPDVRQAIEKHVRMIAPPQTRQSLLENLNLLSDVEVIFSGWGAPLLDDRFFELAPKLRAVFHAGGEPRLSHVAEGRGVVMTSGHLANSIPVAEYTLATILFSLKHGWRLARQTREQQTFPDRNGAPGSYDRTVGIVGLGMVARLLLKLLGSFDLRVLAYDPFVASTEAAELGVEIVSLDDIFSRSHVVTLHAQLNAQTEGMVTGRHLSLMRSGATFINTARGALVCENEMIHVAGTRPDLQFVLDVTSPEPPIAGSPLYKLPNIIVTPHIAGSAGGECRRMGHYLAEELERYVTGQPLKWAVSNDANGASSGRKLGTIQHSIHLRDQSFSKQRKSLHLQ